MPGLRARALIRRRLLRPLAGDRGGFVCRQQRHDNPLSHGACGCWGTALIGSMERPGCASGRFKTCSTRLANSAATLGASRTTAARRSSFRRRAFAAARRGCAAICRASSSAALLMAAPYAAAPVELEIDGPLVSQPYIRMTLAVMRTSASIFRQAICTRFRIPRGAYRGRTYDDRAGRFGRQLFLRRRRDRRRPGDRCGTLARQLCKATSLSAIASQQMGCEVSYSSESITVIGGKLRGIDVDMNAISDTVQTLSAVALFADGPTTIRDVAHIRHKETDRIGDSGHRAAKASAQRSRNCPTACESSPARCTALESRPTRSPHGNEPGARRPCECPGVDHRGSALHGEDLSELLPGSGGGCQFIEIGLMTDSTGGKGGNRGFNLAPLLRPVKSEADQAIRRLSW